MKLVTWNIQWGRGVDGRVDLDRIIDHARRFADFDVLCLQEVSDGFADLAGNDDTDQFAGFASRLPGFVPIAGIATDLPGEAGKRRRFGNMILSRYPVLQTFSHLLPWPPQAGVKSMQRVALEATLDTPLGALRVTTTHLEYYSPQQRRAQVERLRLLHHEAWMQSQNDPVGSASDGPFHVPKRGGPAILTGDFNFLPDSSDKALLTANIDGETPAYQDAWELLHPAAERPPTVGLYDKVQWPQEPFTFDFIFVSSDLAPRVTAVRADPHSDASDHQPMMIELGS